MIYFIWQEKISIFTFFLSGTNCDYKGKPAVHFYNNRLWKIKRQCHDSESLKKTHRTFTQFHEAYSNLKKTWWQRSSRVVTQSFNKNSLIFIMKEKYGDIPIFLFPMYYCSIFLCPLFLFSIFLQEKVKYQTCLLYLCAVFLLPIFILPLFWYVG